MPQTWVINFSESRYILPKNCSTYIAVIYEGGSFLPPALLKEAGDTVKYELLTYM